MVFQGLGAIARPIAVVGLLAAAIGAAFTAAPEAQAQRRGPILDCPLRTAPYSVDSPLIDILLNPRAKAVAAREMPMMNNLPARFNTTVPTFSSIMSLRSFGGMAGAGNNEAQLERVNRALAAVPVTPADQAIRCARYDNNRPNFAIPQGRLRVLVFEKMTGFRDGPSVEAARAAITQIARRNNWGIVVSETGGAINPATLNRFDVVIWNNISGDVLTLTQRRALQNYMQRGGGFVAMHGSGGDPAYFWDWYVDTLIGARFAGHPMNPQFQDARVVIEDRRTSITAGLPAEWVMKDEWYSFKNNPRPGGAKVIATLDERTYSPAGMGGQQLRMGSDHPIVWRKCVGNGRSFYSAIGHMPETYSEPHHVRLLTQAIEWAAGQGDTLCRAGREVPQRRRR
jgi:type 1 glutamine amidotransferase